MCEFSRTTPTCYVWLVIKLLNIKPLMTFCKAAVFTLGARVCIWFSFLSFISIHVFSLLCLLAIYCRRHKQKRSKAFRVQIHEFDTVFHFWNVFTTFRLLMHAACVCIALSSSTSESSQTKSNQIKTNEYRSLKFCCRLYFYGTLDFVSQTSWHLVNVVCTNRWSPITKNSYSLGMHLRMRENEDSFDMIYKMLYAQSKPQAWMFMVAATLLFIKDIFNQTQNIYGQCNLLCQ